MYSSKQVDIIAIITCLIASSIWDIFLLRLLSFILVVFELKNIWWKHVEIERKGSLKVVITSSTYNVMKGSSHTITAMLPEKSMPSNFYWTRDTIDLTKSMSGKYLFGPSPYPLLTIINFSSKDAGEYICHVQNDIKYVSSNSVHLTCIECLKMYITTASKFVANGRDHMINCNISGTPTASSLSWSKFSKNGTEEVIDPCGNSEKYSGGTLDNPTLTVIGFTFGDEGKYLCRVENIAGGTESNTVQLSCVGKLLIQTELQETAIETDRKKTIKCTLSGRATSILWLRVPYVVNNESSEYLDGNLSSPSLTISEVRSEHEGMYICCAANEAGIVSTSNEIMVHYKLNQIEQDDACNNYYRLVAFIMDIAITVIHNYVTSCILKGSTFEDYLLKNVQTILHVSSRQNQRCCSSKCRWKKIKTCYRTFRKDEFDKLFSFNQNKSAHTDVKGIYFCCCPYIPNSVAVSSLDISLTYSIIEACEDWRALWPVLPPEAYRIKEIKDIRNQIFHMSDSKTVGIKKFNKMWDDLKYSVTFIAREISKEELKRVEKQILDKKKMVRISEDDIKQHQLYRSYWRDKCLEFEQQLTDEFDKSIEEVFKELLHVADDITPLVHTETFSFQDGAYEIELFENVAMNNLYNGKEEIVRSREKEENSSKQTKIDADMHKINENKTVKDNGDALSEATTSTSMKESKVIPVLFKVEVPNDWDTEEAIKAIEIMRTSNTDKDIKIKSYSLDDLQVIADIIKKRLTKQIIKKFIKKIVKGIQPDTTENKPIQVSVLVPEQLTMKLTTQKEKIIKGSSHTIKCEISGIPKPNKIWWMKDGLERKGEDSASLVFDEFQPTDEGCYICYAKNAAGTSESDPLSLICLEKPTVLLHSEELQIIKGSNHIIKCSVSGKPIPNTLSWKKRINKDDTTVDLTEAKYAGGTVDSPSLTIKDFDMSDEGTYTCQAINEAGEGCSEELLLLCIEKLTLKLTTQKEKIIKGSSHTIECKISGIPKSNQIWWMKDNVKRKGRDLASLVFKEFQLSDEGCYICYATNAAGTSKSGELTLECIEKPKVVIPSEKLQIIKGSNQIISCSVSGKPQPSTLSWTKRVNENEHGEQTVDSTGEKYSGGTIDCPSLTIKDFDISDEGTYACQATNEAGDGCSDELQLLCIETPVIEISSENQHVIRASDHTLACSVSGKPPPKKMSWIKRLNGVDTVISQTGKKYSGGTIDCPSLTINDFDMRDEGAYICQAINDAGEGFSEALYLACIEKPVVQISIVKEQVIKGSNQIITCTVSGKPQPTTLSWKKRINGVETTVDLSRKNYSGGTVKYPSLTIKDFDMSNEGIYTCQAKNDAGEGFSNELHLSCIEKPVIEISSENQQVIMGSDQTLTCLVSRKPQPNKMSWIKRVDGVDTPVDLTGAKYSGGTIDCPSLTIKDFTMSDEGTYTCQATNEAGEGFSEALYLSCIEKPTVQISIERQHVIKGSNEIITCKVSGLPLPTTLSWKKKRNGVETVVDLTEKSYSGGTVEYPSLTIKDFDMSNEGKYTCLVTNEAGEGCSNELHLLCIEKLVIKIFSENQQVNRGTDHTLTCSVSGRPPPTKMSWIKRVDGVETTVGHSGNKYSGGTIDCPPLTIKDFEMSDEGSYICQATNEAGEGFSEALYLSCIEKPTVQISIERQHVIKGSNEIITCKVSGLPLPTTLSWKKKTNGVETAVDLTGKNYSGGTVEHPSLTIKGFNMSNDGAYTCQATNDAGEGCSNELHLLCIEKPVIKISSEKHQVISGSDQTLTCSVSDKPLPIKLSWIKEVDGVETTVGQTVDKYLGGTIDCPSLTIKDFDMSDEGSYICQATNEAGEGFSDALYLSCIEKPTVQILIERQHVIKGSNEIITCKFSGKHLPTTLTWKKKTNGVETAVDLTGKSYSGGTVEHPSLTIKDFDMSNEGTYTCQATNDAGEGCSNKLHLSCIDKVIQLGHQKFEICDNFKLDDRTIENAVICNDGKIVFHDRNSNQIRVIDTLGQEQATLSIETKYISSPVVRIETFGESHVAIHNQEEVVTFNYIILYNINTKEREDLKITRYYRGFSVMDDQFVLSDKSPNIFILNRKGGQVHTEGLSLKGNIYLHTSGQNMFAVASDGKLTGYIYSKESATPRFSKKIVSFLPNPEMITSCTSLDAGILVIITDKIYLFDTTNPKPEATEVDLAYHGIHAPQIIVYNSCCGKLLICDAKKGVLLLKEYCL